MTSGVFLRKTPEVFLATSAKVIDIKVIGPALGRCEECWAGFVLDFITAREYNFTWRLACQRGGC